jgi:nitrogenase subunit NifH
MEEVKTWAVGYMRKVGYDRIYLTRGVDELTNQTEFSEFKIKVTDQVIGKEYYKQYVEGVPLTQDEVIDAYVEAYTIAEKKKNKQIKDKINALKSKLAEEKRQKLTKITNQERVKELEVQIKILQEICG